MDVINQYLKKFSNIVSTLGCEPYRPKVVTIGNASAGKSSVIQSILGFDCIPIGVSTRCPLIIELNYAHELSWSEMDELSTMVHIEFDHIPNRIFCNLESVKKEIEERTISLCGPGNKIEYTPIKVRMFSSIFADMTLIDLPGLVKLPVSDQPASVEDDISALAEIHIEPKDCIILAISQANSNIRSDEALKMALEIDPSRERTILVVTKLDLMDQGSDAKDLLMGEIISMNIIGVVNRGHLSVKSKKSLELAEAEELNFLKANYANIASAHGSSNLIKMITKLIKNLLRDRVQESRRKLTTKIDELNGVRSVLNEMEQAETDTN